jgi:hypothetical protein
MRPVESINSNSTGLFVCEEVTPGVTPAAPAWIEQEPNSYDNFGAELKTVQRMPINANRRNKKGTVVGYTAGAGFDTDLTPENLREIMQGFFFSSARRKSAIIATAVTADGFTVPAGGAAYVAGTLIAAAGSTLGVNNGLHVAVAGSDADTVAVDGLAAVAGQSIRLSRAGIEFAAGDAAISVGGPLPALTTTAFDLTTLGLIPGEIVYLGGDDASETFGAAAKGWCRVKSIAAHSLVFDKTDFAFQAASGAGKTIRLFFGTVIRDEDQALQVQRTYSIMRKAGAIDLDAPNVIQAEIVTRCVANQFKLTVPEEDKVTASLSFMGSDSKYYADINAAFAGGTYLTPIEADAINSTGDMKRAVMSVYPKNEDNSAPSPLFAVFSEYDITIDNQIKENKAVTRMGTFVTSPGNFMVTGSFTGYFVTLDAMQAVRDNADVTFMMAAWKANKGVALDLPMVSLSSKGLEVKINEPIMIPIDSNASTGAKYDANMAHTALMVFYDYLPDVAND